MKKALIILLILFSQWIHADEVSYPWKEAIEKADFVVRGKVVKLKLIDNGLYKVKFKIDDVIKGSEGGEDVEFYYLYQKGLDIGLPEIEEKREYTLCLYWSNILNRQVLSIRYQSDVKIESK